jgi:hypothetical protein
MAGRYKKNPTGNRARLHLSVDPEVLEDAKELLHGSGKSISDVVSELLKLEVAKMRASSGEAPKAPRKRAEAS